MYKIRYNGNGECMGPAVFCDQCHGLIENTDTETSLLTWRTPMDMAGVKEVPIIFLHDRCIETYAKRHKKPYGEWNGVKLSEAASDKLTIYNMDPELT